jgi:hypothetical protein
MPNFNFTGAVIVNLYNDVQLSANPPGIADPYISVINFGLQPIIWADPKPPDLILNQTPFGLVNNLTGFREITFSPTFKFVTGLQNYGDSTRPVSEIIFNNEVQVARPAAIGIQGTAVYNGINLPFQNIATSEIGNDQQITIFIWNSGGDIICSDNIVLCQNPVAEFTLNLVLEVTISILCEGIGLENGICTNICLPTAGNFTNANRCLPDYLDYCFTPGLTGIDVIWTNNACQTFIREYIQEVNPLASIDEKLTSLCETQVPGVNVFRTLPQNQQDLCGCHLNPEIYANLRRDLQNEFPGSILAGEIAPCLFPGCVDSDFKSTVTTKTCPVPQCINIASINNNGNIQGGGNIIQNDKNCQDLAKKGSGNDPSGNNPQEKSWLDKYWYWLVIGIGLVVILIIVILIVIAGESNKKKSGNPKMLKKE